MVAARSVCPHPGLSKDKLPGRRARWYTRSSTDDRTVTVRTLTLASADVKILIAAIVFFALLVILLTPDGYVSSGLLDSGFPVPTP
jgi:hypothetical protein